MVFSMPPLPEPRAGGAAWTGGHAQSSSARQCTSQCQRCSHRLVLAGRHVAFCASARRGRLLEVESGHRPLARPHGRQRQWRVCAGRMDYHPHHHLADPVPATAFGRVMVAAQETATAGATNANDFHPLPDARRRPADVVRNYGDDHCVPSATRQGRRRKACLRTRGRRRRPPDNSRRGISINCGVPCLRACSSPQTAECL